MTESPFVILYVEDDEFVRESFAELLATPERRILTVGDVAGAREVLSQNDVDLLITDLNLGVGGTSGEDLAREALQQNPSLLVIICSGHDSTELVQSLGPTARALRKPVDFDKLEALIERLDRGT